MAGVGVFVQARLGSTRFPRKVVEPLFGKPLIEWVVERLTPVPADVHVVVTDLGSLSTLQPIVKRHPPWEVFAGSPTDVMKRYIDAAHYYKVGVIVRATGDNPLVDTNLATWMLGTHLRCDGDWTRVLGATPGTAVEVVNLECLEDLWPYASPEEREHVMPLAYECHAGNVLHVRATYDEPVTVDTPSDLRRVEGVLKGE